MAEWIKTKDRVPDESCFVLCMNAHYFPFQPIQCVYEADTGSFVLCHNGSLPLVFPCQLPIEITHWVRLPRHPAEESDD